jgi:hypothetical protein
MLRLRIRPATSKATEMKSVREGLRSAASRRTDFCSGEEA